MKIFVPLAILAMLQLVSCKPDEKATRRAETLEAVRSAAENLASKKAPAKNGKPLEVANYSAAMQKLETAKSAAAADGWTTSEITTAEHQAE
ncbi:MAG: hypothetical protein EOP84_27320 [Verrucomicrobiaceae bacterium]|nr:MAG: hypothetical protein EOP84_27320 [Verrucomicrobiaceae bacterium]